MNSTSDNDDLLIRYAIFLAGERLRMTLPDDKLSRDARARVEARLKAEPHLWEEVYLMRDSYIEVYKQMDGTELGESTLKEIKTKPILPRSAREYSTFKYPAWAAVIGLIVFLTLTAISKMNTPSYYPIIQKSMEEKLSVPRSGSSTSLERAKALFNMAKYAQAIELLEQELHERGRERRLSALYLGRAHLNLSESKLFGFHLGFDTARLDSAKKYLMLAREQSDLPKQLLADAQWYAGLVSALYFHERGDRQELVLSRDLLKKVIAGGGRRADKAKRLLQELE